MTDSLKTERSRVRRLPDRGHYDRETIYAILDEALVCHVSFVQDGQPFVIPTLHARDGDALLLHGATTSRLLHHIAAGGEVCVAVTLLDGLVLAKSVFHHSVNYRSVVLFGRGELVEGDAAKLAALEIFTEKLTPGRWAEARQPERRRTQGHLRGAYRHRRSVGQGAHRRTERRPRRPGAGRVGGSDPAVAGARRAGRVRLRCNALRKCVAPCMALTGRYLRANI